MWQEELPVSQMASRAGTFYVKVVGCRGIMTEIAIVIVIFIGLLVDGIWLTVGISAPDKRPKCARCSTTKRTLQWIKSWEDWYCWRCKEKCIHAALNALIGERA
jgi:hypothetical protein